MGAVSLFLVIRDTFFYHSLGGVFNNTLLIFWVLPLLSFDNRLEAVDPHSHFILILREQSVISFKGLEPKTELLIHDLADSENLRKQDDFRILLDEKFHSLGPNQ